MTVKEFLKDELTLLSNAFNHVIVKYEYNHLAETHIVELTPQNEYYHNNKLDIFWIDIADRFMNLFPAENLSFVSSDSIVKVTSPELEFNLPKAESADWFALLTRIANRDLSNAIIPNRISVNMEIKNTRAFATLGMLEIKKLDKKLITNWQTNILQPHDSESYPVNVEHDENSDKDTYAMAA